MNRISLIQERLLVASFWILIATILIFQLSTADEYTFQKALIYSLTMTSTFAVFIHLLSKKIIKKHIQTKMITTLIFWILVLCFFASILLTVEDYLIVSFFTRDWEQHEVFLIPQFFGMFLAVVL